MDQDWTRNKTIDQTVAELGSAVREILVEPWANKKSMW